MEEEVRGLLAAAGDPLVGVVGDSEVVAEAEILA